MAKAKFDRADVVAAATELFWRKGYNCASMQDVFRATGLQPGSLYNAFGNKEGLYEESVRFYGAMAVKYTLQTLSSQDDSRIAICLLLRGVVEETEKPSFKSCLLAKSLLELNSMGNQRLADVVNDQLDAVTQVFTEALTEYYGGAEAELKADSVMLSCMGLRVSGFGRTGSDGLLAALRSNLSWLPWEEALSLPKSEYPETDLFQAVC